MPFQHVLANPIENVLSMFETGPRRKFRMFITREYTSALAGGQRAGKVSGLSVLGERFFY